ncbi:SusC/RagA family TonB-linked outer membrane protein [Elizabethkingia meningoseptica]|uniref:SusC/RagA family protein n=1 Tax=Elizabethkingia meningoseptica TaxID=238 RepID=A0A1V3TXC3_ELIME|nr:MULTISPECIES: SusC/RagA family TonB-linked outer membrane protein [Elizabethkingia]AQX12337.1 SusC/RagA family protein [Elizabethkingia meningoseptica]EJK5329624.1 SusC/RagA family TonB-linked outer membrane protein [Elizabethkingia meningoseptica]MBG0513867.1 SusC/RagA family TonB-linked outer membrane protein [Elizabethkingia meningoseptica]MCL1675775.1 SusC/RagA family TonB-linked outer membrane protein [Elizabethkingia meningoseptica]MCL1686810.1 SusC/RagA family TonB-linked outer membr
MKKVVIRIGLLQVPMLLASVMSYGQKKDSLKTSSIDEVVVTAYGIKKEKKALGYVYQDIKGSDVVEAREVNVTDAMVGKVSGLQLVKSSTGPSGSSKIILRGFNSLTNDNQPLIVVDGVPMSNFAGSKNNDFWNAEPDMGNGLSDLNSEDIENITVLKGGAASALYGSRAGNGVIMITTKKGKRNKGAGITYSNTLSIETMFVYPQVQRDFSQGTDGKYVADSGLSWGEKITGQTVKNWEGKDETLRSYDNLNAFFKPGMTETNSITFQQAVGDNTSIYSSLSYLNSSAMIPNSKYNRLNFMSRVSTKFGENKKWSSDFKIQYMNTVGENRPTGGHDSGYYGGVLGLPTTIDLGSFKEGMDVLGAKARWYVPNTGANPYWSVYNQLNKDARNRFMINASLKYEFTDWMNAEVKVGSDFYNTKTEGKTYSGGPRDNFYSTGQDRFMENNYIASLNFKKDNLVGKWSGAFSVFGQIMTSNFNSNRMSGKLDVPDYFSVKNFLAYNADRVNEDISKKQINSVFATIDIDYDGFWFVNATARNDWSSTMIRSNMSYFYPSVSTSLVITDMFKKLWDNATPFGKVITFAKIRGSYAVTGNSLDSRQLYNSYRIGHDPLGNINASPISKTLYNSNVVSELLKTYEFGANFRFFNRVDLDVNYYNTHATRQLIDLPLNALSGYTSKKINAGDIQNKGIEVTLSADILRKQDFKWNMNVNFSKNTNKIIDIAEGVTAYPLIGFDNLAVTANPGQRYGVLFGTRYKRVQDINSPFYGKKILDANGLPLADEGQYVLGDQTPRALLGFTNRFSYKNLTLSFQIDGRFGGQFYSGTMNSLKANGLAQETVVNGARDKFVVDGVVADGTGYKQNTTAVTPQNYWFGISTKGNLGINEENIYDATNVRLRNVQLTYSLPKSLFKDLPLQSAKVSFSVNNVWMIYSKVKGVDPEASYALSSNATGFEYLSFPTTRSYVFNLTLGF